MAAGGAAAGAQRLVDDPDGALWYAARRIFAFALMIRDGIPSDEVEPYLRARAWLADAAGLLRRTPQALAVMTDRNGDLLQVDDAVMWASSISCGRCVPCVQLREPTLGTARRTYGVNRVADDRTGPTGSWSQAKLLHDGATVVRLPEGVDQHGGAPRPPRQILPYKGRRS